MTTVIHVAWLRSGIRGIYDLTATASEALITLGLDPDFALSGRSRGQQLEQREDWPPTVAAISRFLDAVRSDVQDPRLCRAADAAGSLAVTIACERSLESASP